jgi:hypothetical protein
MLPRASSELKRILFLHHVQHGSRRDLGPHNGLAAMLQAGPYIDVRACAAGTAAQCPSASSRAVCPPKVGTLARPTLTNHHFTDENQGLSASAACSAACDRRDPTGGEKRPRLPWARTNYRPLSSRAASRAIIALTRPTNVSAGPRSASAMTPSARAASSAAAARAAWARAA